MAVPKNPRRAPVNVDGLAEYLNVSAWWVRGAVQDRLIPFSKVGRHLRFNLDKIDAWVEENSFDPADPAPAEKRKEASR